MVRIVKAFHFLKTVGDTPASAIEKTHHVLPWYLLATWAAGVAILAGLDNTISELASTTNHPSILVWNKLEVFYIAAASFRVRNGLLRVVAPRDQHGLLSPSS